MHVGVAFAGGGPGFVDEGLGRHGRERRVIAWTPRFHALPELVLRTAALATLPRCYARHAARGLELVADPAPFAISRR